MYRVHDLRMFGHKLLASCTSRPAISGLFLFVLLFVIPFGTLWSQGLKISERPDATTPLVGDEILGIIQSGLDRKTTVSTIIGGAVTGWPTVSSTKEITWANSEANGACIGQSATECVNIFWDAALGARIRPKTHSNTLTEILPNFTWSLWDTEASLAIETVDPDAGTKQGIWTYASAYRPLKSVYFSAGALNTDGTQCGQPTERTINSGALRYTIICTDNDASTIYGEVEMPDSWDGSTVTLMGSFVQTAADTANLNADVAMACRVDGDTINNTWGTEIAMDTALGGSNKIDTVTTGAITPNGTCTGAGTLLQFRWQLDAAGTTTAVATLHTLGFKLVYATKSRSD